jgi:eukaryotic-like serine/threonine-protein kinase
VGDSVLVGGRCAIYDKIASGGMATVHFGRLLGGAGFARTVAIKRLHPHLSEEPDFVSMMIDEARLVARVHHPNVVPTLDVVAVDGELLIVMEYVQGESLGRLLSFESARQRPVPLPIVSAIIGGVLHGLHAAHEAKSDRGEPLGIVHRDISPQNVMVGVDGISRVIDFGVAKAAGRLQTTREGVVKGKVPYMAPEQISGKPATRSTDIYSVGVVLWETLTQRRLFDPEDQGQLIGLVLAGPEHPPRHYVPGLPEELAAVAMRALAKSPDARFATALEMASALEQAVPPALPREVGAWVEGAAHDTLSARATKLAEIETDSSGRWAAQPAKTDSRQGKSDNIPPTSLSQPSMSAPVQPKTATDGTRWRLPRGAAWALAGLASLVGIVLFMRSGGTPHTVGTEGIGTRDVPAAPAQTPTSVSVAAVVSPPTPAPSLATTASDSPAPRSLSAAAENAAMAAPAPPRPGTAAKSVQRTRSTPPRVDCNPPWTVDSTGLRTPKQECYGVSVSGR